MITLSVQDDASILAVEGALDRTGAEQLREHASVAMQRDARDFVVDFRECTGIDSSGLEALTWLTRECEERLGMCKLAGLSETLAKIVDITRLDKQLSVCGSLEEAFAALK